MFPPQGEMNWHPKRSRQTNKAKNRRGDESLWFAAAKNVSCGQSESIRTGATRRIAEPGKDSPSACRPGLCFEFGEVRIRNGHDEKRQQQTQCLPADNCYRNRRALL